MDPLSGGDADVARKMSAGYAQDAAARIFLLGERVRAVSEV
jgi:hypothetical protein